MMAPPTAIAWKSATLRRNAALATQGTFQLELRTDIEIDYKPGHVLGLQLPDTGGDKPLGGPYTVTRRHEDGMGFDVIYRVVEGGRKTPTMQQLGPGASVNFGGKFATPVEEGLNAGCISVIGVSTGAGVGPLLGFAEESLTREGGPKIELYTGYREAADVACAAELDALAAAHPAQFRWCACISAEDVGDHLKGRVTEALPPVLGARDLQGHHFHLVGNGQMVKEMRAGLEAAGVEEGWITTETYFNGKAEPNPEVVQRITEQVTSAAAPSSAFRRV